MWCFRIGEQDGSMKKGGRGRGEGSAEVQDDDCRNAELFDSG